MVAAILDRRGGGSVYETVLPERRRSAFRGARSAHCEHTNNLTYLRSLNAPPNLSTLLMIEHRGCLCPLPALPGWVDIEIRVCQVSSRRNEKASTEPSCDASTTFNLKLNHGASQLSPQAQPWRVATLCVSCHASRVIETRLRRFTTRYHIYP